MRVPPFYQYTRWMAGFGLFVCGMVVGAAVYMSIHQQLYTELVIDNTNQREELTKLQEAQQQANKSKSRASTIWDIKVTVETDEREQQPLDAITVGEIEKKIRANLASLRGKQASILQQAPMAFYHLIEEPVYKTTNDKRYKVKVTLMLFLQSELHISVKAWEQLVP